MRPAPNSPASRWTSWNARASGREAQAQGPGVEGAAFAYAKPARWRRRFELLREPGREGPRRRPEPDPVAQHAAVVARAAGGHHRFARTCRNIEVAGRSQSESARWSPTPRSKNPPKSESTCRCSRRRCRTSRTPRSATAARSAAASRSPIRPPNTRRARLLLMPFCHIKSKTAERRVKAETVLQGPVRDRPEAGRDPDRGRISRSRKPATGRCSSS